MRTITILVLVLPIACMLLAMTAGEAAFIFGIALWLLSWSLVGRVTKTVSLTTPVQLSMQTILQVVVMGALALLGVRAYVCRRAVKQVLARHSFGEPSLADITGWSLKSTGFPRPSHSG